MRNRFAGKIEGNNVIYLRILVFYVLRTVYNLFSWFRCFDLFYFRIWQKLLVLVCFHSIKRYFSAMVLLSRFNGGFVPVDFRFCYHFNKRIKIIRRMCLHFFTFLFIFFICEDNNLRLRQEKPKSRNDYAYNQWLPYHLEKNHSR